MLVNDDCTAHTALSEYPAIMGKGFLATRKGPQVRKVLPSKLERPFYSVQDRI